ncbi:uncharacterized protein LOC143883510 [Tasmannia lanceolata]|uniref:uncharacterized protein LOC143883510 n=1 Tax=Tasmannia lanceolata TaxID=3420 RepID=UPI004064BA65
MEETKHHSPAIGSVPYDLMAEIVSRVGSSSLKALVNTKLACKELNEAGADVRVFQRASLESLPAVNWRLPDGASSFLRRCEESSNPESLYRLGMVEYFSSNETESGCELLKKASELGNLEATYALGLILLSEDSSSFKGLALLNKVEKNKSNKKGIEGCRSKSEKILRQLWIKKTIRRREIVCCRHTCRNGRMRGGWRGQWSTYEEESFCCQACKWNNELNDFVRILLGPKTYR